MVKRFHYSHGGSNTATYAHGLFKRGELWEENCLGMAWWLPPTKGAALSAYPENWQGVLCLSRLVILPEVPKNACSFLLSRSMNLIDRKRWPCLLTYADEWQGHTGGIYRATNWQYSGLTKPEATYVRKGRMISRKAGAKTRTREEMRQLGAENVGAFSKHRFIHLVIEKEQDHERTDQEESSDGTVAGV